LATYQAAYHHIQDRHDDAGRIWSRIAAAAERAGDVAAAAHAQVRVGATLIERSYSAAALQVLDECVQVFDRTTNADALATVLYWRAECALDLDDFVQSQRDAQRGVVLAQRTGNRHAECMNLRSLASSLALLGHHGEALQAGQRALALAEELGDESYVKVTLHSLSRSYTLVGEYGRAAAICQRNLELCRRLGDARLEALTLGMLGDAYHGLGRHQDAVNVLSSALPVFKEHAIGRYEALCLLKLGYAHRALDQRAQAIQQVKRSLPIFQELRLARYEERAQRFLDECFGSS
jgi:tetratricopeptide (TPR) repeat protein